MEFTQNIFILFGAIVINVIFYILSLVINRFDKASFIIYQVFLNSMVLLLFVLPKYMWKSSSIEETKKP